MDSGDPELVAGEDSVRHSLPVRLHEVTSKLVYRLVMTHNYLPFGYCHLHIACYRRGLS